MERVAPEQGPSHSFSLSPEDVLLRYVPRRRQTAAKDRRVEETRPILANEYFSVDYEEVWKPSLLQSFGETCHRATFVNDFHILLCSRRLVLVGGSSGAHLTFPPFEEVLNDAYAERVSPHCVLVIAALSSGVHVALVSDQDNQRASTLQSTFCPTASPVVRIHHLKKCLYGLCCDNCTVESLSVQLGDALSVGTQLEARVLPSQGGWGQTVLGYFTKRRYVHSFFDHYKGYLLVLSTTSLSLWTYHDESLLRLESSVDVSKLMAVAVVAAPVEGDAEGQIAVVVTSDGGRLQVCVAAAPPKAGQSQQLMIGDLQVLPSTITNTAVSLTASSNVSLLLADQVTSSLVLTTQCEPFCEAYHSPTTHVVSQVFVGKRICGVGVERRGDEGGEAVTFLVYCGDSTIARIRRVSRGLLLRRLFAASALTGVAALHLLHPVRRADVLLDAALGGLPLQHVSDCLAPLLLPRGASTGGSAELSDGAKGILEHTMRSIGDLSRLCSSFQYWRLSEELAQSRTRLENSCAVLTEVLNAGGWLDCPVREDWRWSSDLRVGLKDMPGGRDASAVNAQAELLQLLLSSLKHAASIAWLYDMVLQSGLGYRFPGRLEDTLWKGDPSAVEAAFCMDLLALGRKEVTERLLESEQELPRRCRLAAALLSLVQTESFDDVAAYVRKHIVEIARCDLLGYTNDVLEKHFPARQSRLLLLVYYYPHHREASTEIIAIVEQMQSADLLRRTLCTILGDPACDGDLAHVVLDWMESHSLADHRIATFAEVIVAMQLDVDPAQTPAARFFSSYKQAAAGHTQQASFRFGELARSELAVPLAGRLLAIGHALQATVSDIDRITQFILLLQQQLANLLDEHLRSGKDLLLPRSSVAADLALLREHCLSESRLFELAGRYKALGGCSIQLDLLKIHPDAEQFTIASAITGVLTFLTAVGLSAAEAVRRVLQEYLDSFQAPLPLFPFVERMALDGLSPSEAMDELAAAGVQLPVLFDTFMALLDRRENPQFPICETVMAVARLVARMDLSVQHICAAHLLECSRSLLEGEPHANALSDGDAALVKGVADQMRELSQHERR